MRYEQPGVAVRRSVPSGGQAGCCDSSLCVNDLSLKDINVAIDSEKCRSLRR
jgi:translocation and assembly module TamB